MALSSGKGRRGMKNDAVQSTFREVELEDALLVAYNSLRHAISVLRNLVDDRDSTPDVLEIRAAEIYRTLHPGEDAEREVANAVSRARETDERRRAFRQKWRDFMKNGLPT